MVSVQLKKSAWGISWELILVKVVWICSKTLQLTAGSHHLSQVEKKKRRWLMWQNWANFIMVLYMSFSFCLLGVEWFFSSWERKNCLQSWANSQNDHYFHPNNNLGPFWVKVIDILWICSALLVVLSFSSWEKSCV